MSIQPKEGMLATNIASKSLGVGGGERFETCSMDYLFSSNKIRIYVIMSVLMMLPFLNRTFKFGLTWIE